MTSDLNQKILGNLNSSLAHSLVLTPDTNPINCLTTAKVRGKEERSLRYVSADRIELLSTLYSFANSCPHGYAVSR